MANIIISSAQPSLEEQLSGLELQPYVMVNSFNHVVDKDQIEQIVQNLREQVSKSVKEMKVLNQPKIKEGTSESNFALAIVPLSTVFPEEVEAPPDRAPKRRGRRTTTKVVGEIFVSYELPQICVLNNIDLDQIPLYGEQASDTNKSRQYSFAERLENWSLQQRERSNGMRDIYYHHARSSCSFRSITEVVNFLVFEIYPPKPNTKTNEAAEATDASATHSASSSGKKKQKYCGDEDEKKKQVNMDKAMDASEKHSTSSGKKQKYCGGDEDEQRKQVKTDKAMVVKFFMEASRNMMNFNLNEPDDSSEDEI